MLVRLPPNQSPNKVSPPTFKRSFKLDFKFKIVNEAFPKDGKPAQKSLKQIARENNLQPSQIRRWKRNQEWMFKQLDLDMMSTRNRTKYIRRVRSAHFARYPGGGRNPAFPKETLQKIKDFYDTKRENGEAVSMLQLRLEAQYIDPTACGKLTECALRNRLFRLLRRWNISWRRSTHQAQGTRHSEKVIEDFSKYVLEKATMLGCKPENIYNADQTNAYFSNPAVNTYADTGSKTVSVKKTDSTQRCTVMLCAGYTGEKVIPYIVYKGANTKGGKVRKEINRREGYPIDCELTVQENAWFDKGVMLDWIERVWKREVAVDPDEVYYLLIDSFTTHMTREVRQAFNDCNTEVDFIPPNYTSRLQMLDVGVNRPFKMMMRKQFEEFVCKKHKRPERRDVAHWITEAWDEISPTTITNSWRKVLGGMELVEDAPNVPDVGGPLGIVRERDDPLALDLTMESD
jgi:transposase-like protein